MTLDDLDTPSLILDGSILERNVSAMTRRARSLGVQLRPHMKTAKSIDVARMALAGNFGGITVSTLKEAEYFAAAGVRDIVYAVGIVPAKLPRVAALRRAGVDIAVVTDRADIAHALSARCVDLGVEIAVLIELDTGEHRSGLAPESPALVELGMALQRLPGVSLRGVLTHAGHSYGGRSVEQVQAIAEHERAATVGAAQRLRAAGLPCPVVSVGSTPTAVHARHLEGVTELRCGVYMFGDVFQSAIRSCAGRDIAVSVLATIIGHREALNCAVIDAGALALSKDRSTAAEGLPEDVGFGLVTDALGAERIDGMHVSRVYQEHGLLSCQGGGRFPFERLPVGARVRVFPNHACLTAAMYESYHVIRGGHEVVAVWPRINGWQATPTMRAIPCC
jgi:D-serine deaminase-like pyridoxal phosphate-dependent protein